MAESSLNATNSPAESDGRQRRLADCFARGEHLAKVEKNHEYAHALFTQCVLEEPGNLQFVEAMVQNLRASRPHLKKSPLRLHHGGSRALKKAVQHKEWRDVFRLGLELLNADPWDVVTLQAMAEACEALHHNQAELVYLKQALDTEPKNVDVNRHCGRSLGRMGQFDQAIACWHRVETLRGKDEEAAKMISFLAEEKLRYPGGRPPTAHATPAPATNVESESVEEASPQDVVLSPRQELEQAIASDPTNVTNYLDLVALLLETDQFNAAEAVLSRAMDACGQQPTVMERLEKVRYLRAEEQRMLAEEQRAAKQLTESVPFRIPWLELTLGFAVLALVLQFVPSLAVKVWNIIDIRNWSSTGRFAFSVFILVVLLMIRFAPELREHLPRKLRRRQRVPRDS